jgi:hypothetical protein
MKGVEIFIVGIERLPIRAARLGNAPYFPLSLRGDPREPWQSIFCIVFVVRVFRPAKARQKQRDALIRQAVHATV